MGLSLSTLGSAHGAVSWITLLGFHPVRGLDGYPPLAYNRSLIFIETPVFERYRDSHFDDDQYRLLQAVLMARPDAGDLIRGSGGVRKVRWAVEGRGKRGGLRVIY